MEELESARFDGIVHPVKKKRSQASRRPRPESHSLADSRDSTTPPSDDVSKVSSEENGGYDVKSKRKEFNVNQYMSGSSSANGSEGEKPCKRIKEGGGFNGFYNDEPMRSVIINNKRSSEGVLAPANWRRNGENQSSVQLGVNSGSLGNEGKVKKVKLRVGGVTRTFTAANGTSAVGSSKSSHSPETTSLRHKQNLQVNSDDTKSPLDKKSGLQGIPWKDFSSGGFSFGKEDPSMERSSGKNSASGPGRKSKRVPKKRVLDGDFEDDDDDDEIRYLEKLKSSRISSGFREDDDESGKKRRKLTKVSNLENVGTSRLDKDAKKKSRSDRVSEDTDYEEDEDPVSDVEVEGHKKKRQKKEYVDSVMENKREMTLTTRQRALQSSKDGFSAPASSLIEFPNGLPPAPPRKQKEKLSEVEQQLKKAEAAQRRRMQVEKANRESEAEAIRKILGQDSTRKKREDQKKKRLEIVAQMKADYAKKHAATTVRWVNGPNGNVVTFPEEMGFPSIFNSKPCSYPPPRETCVGPSCTNPYKYRDSKTKLPLCSLQCYKAIQEKQQAETTC